MKWMYQTMYRTGRVPWDVGPRPELVEVVESGRVKPCRAIDLGSGTASNVIFLAQRGFEVTGVDYSSAAIEMGRRRAEEADVNVEFLIDDLTDLRHVNGPFDFLVDYGTLDDLKLKDRDVYVENVLPLTHPGSQFLLWSFEWPSRWWERSFNLRMALEPGEVERRFGDHFEIERIAGESNSSGFVRGFAAYLMTRKNGGPQ